MKAQIEFMAVLGVVVLVAIVAYYAYTTGVIFPPPTPGGIGQEQNPIRDSVINEGRAGAALAIEWLEKQGGYIEPVEGNYAVFNSLAVHYWQKCGASLAPATQQLTERLERAVRRYVNNSLYGKQDYFGRNVSFDLSRLSVKANILANKADFEVVLPTRVGGYLMQQPITFSVPTKLGELHEFGRRFADENARARLLEHFTIATIYFSDDLPTQGVLTQCGEGIYLSGGRIADGLENAISYTLANTLWWRAVEYDPAKPRSYSVESVGNKSYPWLDVGLYLPDGFRLRPGGYLGFTNSKHVASGLIFDIAACTGAYDWKYSANYPVIVRVRDDLTGGYFNFAVLVDVNNMLPGSCAGGGTPSPEQLGCTAKIGVVDSSGAPLEGAVASFADLYVGESGANGSIEGPAACGSYVLSIQKDGYGVYTSANTSGINGTYALYRQPVLTFNFNEVGINDVYDTTSWPAYRNLKYSVCSVGPAARTNLLEFKSAGASYGATNADSSSAGRCSAIPSCASCNSTRNSAVCGQCGSECAARLGVKQDAAVDYIPSGSYAVESTLLGAGRLAGGFISNLHVPEQNSSFNVYAPVGSGGPLGPDKSALTGQLRSSCGLEPITAAPAQQGSVIKMAACTCAQLREMAQSELSSCIGSARLSTLFTEDCSQLPCVLRCAVPDVRASVSGCGYGLKGC